MRHFGSNFKLNKFRLLSDLIILSFLPSAGDTSYLHHDELPVQVSERGPD